MDGNMVYGINATKDNVAGTCEPCVMEKQHRTPYRKVVPYQAAGPFGIVHSDVCVPMHVNSFRHSRYYVTFIDDYSRYTCVYFIKRKSEVLETFKEFVSYANTNNWKEN